MTIQCMYNDIYSKANHTVQKVTKTYSSVPCRVMKAHALPDHNFVAFMTLVLVQRNHIIPLKSLPKQLSSYEIRTVTQLCRACLLIKYSILLNTNRRINHYILRKNVSKMNGRMVIGNCVVQRGQDAHIFCP